MTPWAGWDSLLLTGHCSYTWQWSMFHSPGSQNHRTESLGLLELSGCFIHTRKTEWSTLVRWKQKQQLQWDKPYRERWYVFIEPIDAAEEKQSSFQEHTPSLHQASLEWGRNNSSLLSRKVNHCCGTRLAKILILSKSSSFFFLFLMAFIFSILYY